MSESCVASIDQGTSSTRVLIISKSGEVLGSHQMEHKQHYPKSGYVEHDPLEIWKSVKTCLSGALSQVPKSIKIVSVGITNQRETSVVWNKKTGTPYHNAIVWNDTRTNAICDQISKNGGADRFREKTGLPVASYFSATKLMYLLDIVPNLREDAENGEALFGTIDSWIIWRLTNGAVHATDVSNASRTMFMDLKSLQWDEDILSELNIPRQMLPTICPSSHIFGHIHTDSKLAEMSSADDDDFSYFDEYKGVPIAGVLGDQNAALFGQACFQPGDSKCTYGTGAFMLFNTGAEILHSKHGLLTTVAYQLGTQGAVYALEGSVAYSGSVVQWLRDNLGLISSAKESEELASSVPDNGGVYFVPAFAGLFAPYWRGDARGVITGLTAFNTKAHIVRAALESSAFQTVEVSDAMQLDSHHRMPLTTLRVDGGMTANGLLMQFLSDLLEVPLVRPKVSETTALGAAFVAGLAVGLWKNTDELKHLWRADATWTPSMSHKERVRLMRNWRKALDRSLHWVDHDHEHDHEHHNNNSHKTIHKPLHKIATHSSKSTPSHKSEKSDKHGPCVGGGEGADGNDSGGGFASGTVVSSAVASVVGRSRSSSAAGSGSTPLGTTGVPSTSTIVNDALNHGSGKGTGPAGTVRTLTTALPTPSVASAVAALPHPSSSSTAGGLEVPLRSLRYTHTQKFAMCVVVGAAVGFGFAAGAEAFTVLKNRK